MLLRSLLLFLTVTLTCSALRAQMMYRISFSQMSQAAGQDAFFVMYDNGMGFARINNVSAPRTQVDLMERYATDDEGNTDSSMMLYEATGAFYTKDSTPAPVYSFWFRLDQTSGSYRPYAVTSAAHTERPSVSNISSDSLLDPAALSPALVKNYFGIKEDFYLSRFGPRSRGGLSAEDQKTKLFLIVVASTHDESIGEAVGLDARKAIQMFDTVAQSLGIRQNFIVDTVFGDHYGRDNVLKSIQKLKPAKQDIVVFYYTGHGFTDTRKPAQNFPFLDLRDPRIRPRADASGSTLNIESIYESIKAKGARVNLVISDCCNDSVTATARILPPPPRPGRPRGDTTLSIDNLKALFLPKQPFSMLMTAASKNERAVTNIYYGSFFTNNLFQTLRTRFYPQPEKVSWISIMENAQKLTSFQVAKKSCPEPGRPDNKCHQTPFQKLN